MTTANGGGGWRPRPRSGSGRGDLSPWGDFAVEALFFQQHYPEAPEISESGIDWPKNLRISVGFTHNAVNIENCVAWDGTRENLPSCDGESNLRSNLCLIQIFQPPLKQTPKWIFSANEVCCNYNQEKCSGSSYRNKITDNNGRSFKSLLLTTNATNKKNLLNLALVVDNVYIQVPRSIFSPTKIQYGYVVPPVNPTQKPGESLYELFCQIFSNQID
jgi:hypothetical protein